MIAYFFLNVSDWESISMVAYKKASVIKNHAHSHWVNAMAKRYHWKKSAKIGAVYGCSKAAKSIYSFIGLGLNTFDNKLFTFYQVDFYHVQAHAVSNISLDIRNAVNNRQQSPKDLFCLTQKQSECEKNHINAYISKFKYNILRILCASSTLFEPFLFWCDPLAAMCEKLLLVIFSLYLLCVKHFSILFFFPRLYLWNVLGVMIWGISCVPFRCKWCLLLRLLLPLLFNVKLLICPT